MRVRTARGGASIEAHWTGEGGDREDGPFSAAVAAYAASLAVACASEDHATNIAVGEGLVTHLTSLFMSVNDGQRQEGLPLTRRLRLPTPRTALRYSARDAPSSAPRQSPRRVLVGARPAMPASRGLYRAAEPDRVDIEAIAGVIDWDVAADALAQGDLRDLPVAVADAILALSVHEELTAAALGLGIDSLRVAIALVADVAADRARQAARVRRRLLQGVNVAEFEAFARDFDGESGPRA